MHVLVTEAVRQISSVLVTSQVSYKWLSRNFLVSSDTAKKWVLSPWIRIYLQSPCSLANINYPLCSRLLLEFVTSHENGFQVVYSLSGFLKSNPSNYSVRLVPGPKLEGSFFLPTLWYSIL